MDRMTLDNRGSVGQAPEGEKFYCPPTALPSTHGDVIWSRPLEGLAALESASHNELVLYRSEAVDGTPIGISGIVALPQSPPPQQRYPVVSWAHGTLGLGDKCAPSRDSKEMAQNLPEHHLINQAPHGLLNAFLRQGWAVAMTDYEGMGTPGSHPYLLGESEARSVLDMVRAARHLYSQISDQLAIVGHSQGGQAALFAAHYCWWTPELNLRAVAALAPAAHVENGLLRGSQAAVEFPGFAFTPLMLTGALIGSRAGATANGTVIDPAQVLTDQALALFNDSGCKCRVELSESKSWGGILGTDQFRGDLADNPNEDQQEFLRQLALMNPALKIPAPIRIAHAQSDNRLSITDTNTLIAELGALGNDVTYRIYPHVGDGAGLGPHFGIFDTDTPEMTSWLTHQLALKSQP
jgi:pimeloyl-ACP methyl ester carboxylesterase